MKKPFTHIIDEIRLFYAYITLDWKSRRNIEAHHKKFGNSIHPSVYDPEYYPEYYDSFKEWKKDCERSNYKKR